MKKSNCIVNLMLKYIYLFIETAYEKGHQRPALSVYTFQAPDRDNNSCHSQPASPVSSPSSNQQLARVQLRKNSTGGTRPPIPSRCSSLERTSTSSVIAKVSEQPVGKRGKPKLPIPAHLVKGNHFFCLFLHILSNSIIIIFI